MRELDDDSWKKKCKAAVCKSGKVDNYNTTILLRATTKAAVCKSGKVDNYNTTKGYH